MNTIQIIVMTLLAVVAAGALCSVIIRFGSMQARLWIELLVILVTLMFMYLVGR